MSVLTVKLVTGFVALSAIAGASFYVRALHADITRLTVQAQRAQSDVAARDAVINRLNANEQEKIEAHQKLESSRASIAGTLERVQEINKRLVYENAEFRTWSNGALPADVIRMQSAPALTGSADYLEHVPASDGVPVTSDASAN